MSRGIRHVLLCGGLGVGKSRLIERVVRALGWPAAGFVTRFDRRESPDRRLMIGWEGEMRPAVLFEGGQPVHILNEVFDVYGTQLLARKCALRIMDECGRFERGAQAFQRAVQAALDDLDTPVLGVVRRLDAPSWLDALRAHPNACMVEVRVDNRDALVSELTEYFLRGREGAGR